jgi:hypothetical protein
MVSDSALWEGFPFRDGDVVISPPAKSGTTWMQMLCGLLILDTTELPRPLTEISPWLDATTYDHAATVAELEAQPHRRFIKTHTPLDGLPFDQRATYICVGRDPRDAVLSLQHANANVTPEAMEEAAATTGVDPAELEPPPEDPLERFWSWADAEPAPEDHTGFGASLANLVHHVRTFWERRDEPQVALFHYADLQADLPGQTRRLADLLGIDVSDERIEELTAAATFDSMRARADQLAPGVDKSLWRDNRTFFHSGTSGKWRDLLDRFALRRYEDRVSQLAPPDLAAWLHAGSLTGR